MTPRDPVRERLLSVSCELFARQGDDGTSVRDTTRRARVDRVEAIVRTFLGYVAAHPEMPKLILRELAAERPLPPPAQRAMQRNFGALLEAVAPGGGWGGGQAGP